MPMAPTSIVGKCLEILSHLKANRKKQDPGLSQGILVESVCEYLDAFVQIRANKH